MITSDQQKVVKFIHLIPKEGKNNKCYIKVCTLKSFLKLYKTITEFSSCNVPDSFYSKSTQREMKMGTQRTLQGHLRHLGTQRALMHLGTRRALGHLEGTSAFKVFYLQFPLRCF